MLDDIIDGSALRRGGPTLHEATSVGFATSAALFLLGSSSARSSLYAGTPPAPNSELWNAATFQRFVRLAPTLEPTTRQAATQRSAFAPSRSPHALRFG